MEEHQLPSAGGSLGNRSGSASILQAVFKVEKPRIGRHSRRKTKREPRAEMGSVSQPLSYLEAHPAATQGSNACSTRLVFLQSHTHKRDK